MRGIILAAILLCSCGQESGMVVSSPNYQDQIDDVNQRLEDLDKRLMTIQDETNSNITSVEDNVRDLLGQVNMLNDRLHIEKVESPCVDSKEVLVYLSDGRVMAYFQSGNKRYLSILEGGTYVTTDGTNCRFTI